MSQLEEYKGYKINIKQDDNPESPREWDNLGVMFCTHRRYKLGDIQCSGKSDMLHAIAVKANINTTYIQQLVDNETKEIDYSDEELLNLLLNNQDIIILPLYLYDHSGITISTSSFNDSWDSGQVGWIVAFKEDIEKEFDRAKTYSEGEIEDQVKKILEGEVETYDQYLTGDVYGYQIEKPIKCKRCKHIEYNEEDSCWGYYGEDAAREEAKSIIDAIIERNKIINKFKRWWKKLIT